jgi:signal transduction histidine kinase
LEKGSAKFVTIVPDTGKNYKLTQNITCYTQDNTGKILMGTSGGVFLIDPKTDAAPIKYLLDSTEIHYLSFDKQTGSLWIGTYGKGLWVLKKSGELVQFPLDKDKNMSIVHYAITDQQNRVWFSTNNGLYVTTKKNLQDFEAKRSTQVYYYRFSTYDGLIANEFNGGCQLPMILQPDGSLTVSSVAGLAWINTNDAPIDFSSKTLQTEITHGGKILPGAVQSLDIEAGDDSELSIAVLAPDWMPEYNIQLQYRIIKTGDHSQPLWQDVNEQHLVLLPFLSTGDYKLQFRKRTGLNNDDFIYHEITIQKRPYWYQTFYVYPIVLVLLVALGYLFYQWRVVTLRRKNRILKEKVIAATADLKEKNEELATTVKTRDSLILLFNHDLSTPLFYINRLAQSLADTDQIKEPYASDVQLLANSTQDLEEMMNEMLLWIQVQQKNVTIQLLNEPVNIKEVLEKNFDLFRHRLKYHNTITKYLISDELSIFSDKKILSSILYNLISNAIKYTSNGVIQMTAVNDERDSDKVHLIIQSKSDAREIIDTSSHNSTIELNDDTVTKDSADSGEQSRQIGLQLVKSFAAMLHLNIVIDNSIIGVFTVKISGLKLVRNA